MGGVASDFGAIMKVILNDTELKTLMLIPTIDQSDYSKMLTNYFVETYTSEAITTSSICRLLIRSAPSSNTNNIMVREDNLVIEVYVPTSKDRMALFERRSNQIVDKLIKLFHMKSVSDRNFKLEARHELASSVTGFVRMYTQFSYKKVYD
jgi:hypothetical protein